jgi:hypothetical protein
MNTLTGLETLDDPGYHYRLIRNGRLMRGFPRTLTLFRDSGMLELVKLLIMIKG